MSVACGKQLGKRSASTWSSGSLVGHSLRFTNIHLNSFKPTCNRPGLRRIRLYDLRHSCATLLLLAGENPKVVSERLGHAGITLTLDTYAHVLDGMQEQAAVRMEKILTTSSGKKSETG